MSQYYRQGREQGNGRPRAKFMGPSAFGQFEGTGFENRCYTGFWGTRASFSCWKSRFCVFEVINEKKVLKQIKHALALKYLKLNCGMSRGGGGEAKASFSQGNFVGLKFISLNRHLKSLIHILMVLFFELSSMGTIQRYSLPTGK